MSGINQTPENILDILNDTIMGLEETIKGELRKKKGVKVRLINDFNYYNIRLLSLSILYSIILYYTYLTFFFHLDSNQYVSRI